MKPILIMTQGLPGCGKTTWAKEQQRTDPDIVRVNKDDLRAMLHDSKHSKSNEKMVLAVRDFIVETALQRGHDVIVDDTNFAPFHETNLKSIATSCNADFGIKDMTNVPLEVCLDQNQLRDKPVPETVIRDMWAKYLKPEPPKYNMNLPMALIVDLDGTLAHRVTDRSPYEWQRVGEDAVDRHVKEFMRNASELNRHVIIVSGRDAVCRTITEDWLENNRVIWDELHMREEGDMRKDAIVKREIFEKEIKDKYYVYLVLDDRNQVVRMWRDELGLTVWQVADGNF